VNDPAQLRQMLEEAEECVARIRALRDAASGADREDLDKRLRYCARLLAQVRENVAEMERDIFIIDVQRDIRSL
jgi:DNA-binding FrmR family transcriptional regulator